MRELDRIYGIMQVFGLALGSSAEPDKDFTLNDLEDQLGEALNKINPVLAQSFVHLCDPRYNRRWCLQRNMRVFSYSPVLNRELDQPSPFCKILFDHSQDLAKFQGYRAVFEDVVLQFSSSGITFSRLYFDDTTENKTSLPASFLQHHNLLHVRMDEVNDAVKTSFGNDTSILLIGGLDDYQVRTWLGVIAYRFPIAASSGQNYWARIGVCTWLMDVDYLRNTFTGVFTKKKLYLA